MVAQAWMRGARTPAATTRLRGDGGTAMAEVSGIVSDPENDSEESGATVSVVSGASVGDVTSGSDGTFSLMLPVGATVLVRASKAGFISSQIAFVVPQEGVELDLLVLTSAFIDQLLSDAGLNAQQSTNGSVVAQFEEKSDDGGESVTLSATNDGSFTLREVETDAGTQQEAVASSTLLEDGSDVLVFGNVVTGTTTVTPSATTGSCALKYPSITNYQIDANVLTLIRLVCEQPAT